MIAISALPKLSSRRLEPLEFLGAVADVVLLLETVLVVVEDFAEGCTGGAVVVDSAAVVVSTVKTTVLETVAITEVALSLATVVVGKVEVEKVVVVEETTLLYEGLPMPN
jgi:hypothetical protein